MKTDSQIRKMYDQLEAMDTEQSRSSINNGYDTATDNGLTIDSPDFWNVAKRAAVMTALYEYEINF